APSPPRSRDARLIAALAAAKVTGAAIRGLGRGGGTAAPGLVAERIDPRLLDKIASRLPHGSVVVAGTNGKTTVSRMLADILHADGKRVAHNRSGSNLVRGVASALASHADLLGSPRADIGVIESDEAAFPEIVRRVEPTVILLNNLFRDQLDRYGELDAIASRWETALRQLPAESTIVVNVDDPTLAAITEGIRARRITFGLDDHNPNFLLDEIPHAADAKSCRQCGKDLVYECLYSAHLGAWHCPGCSASRPRLDFGGTAIVLEGVDALRLDVSLGAVPSEALHVRLAIPGLYNAYNAVAATAVAKTLGIANSTIANALEGYCSAFGRIARVTYRDQALTLALVKNPVGFNETLRMLTLATDGLSVPTLIAINDLDADGRDVSWLWDVDFEMLCEGSAPLYTTGVRGADMANRLKYAGVPQERINPLPVDLSGGLDAFVDSLPERASGYVLLTYTALLGMRQILADRGAVDHFWDQ
ncbi:MAG TPA: MurT ligase domain-containing protein, partial [Thermomicrobiales bacterium]|nr:MurT ligase domain-containing protein [Thermomicrobiales bacterium]